MHIDIYKDKRILFLWDGPQLLLRASVGLGINPFGQKQQEGDGKTPEGQYTICLIKENGKYGRSLGLSYPNALDANIGLAHQLIDHDTYCAILAALHNNQRPPWGTALGGEIYIHEGGAQTDWTQGCIALNSGDMDLLFPNHSKITTVEIHP